MRDSKEQSYMKIVQAVARRATCNRGRSGAILIRDGRIIATGYVGSPAHVAHCDDVGHEMEKRYEDILGKIRESVHCIRTVHAEMNAILQAAKYGPPVHGAELYCTMFPCYDCAKAIVNAGIIAVHSEFDYQKSDRSKTLFDLVNISWDINDPEVKKYGADPIEV
jgi:dCMP deaminase